MAHFCCQFRSDDNSSQASELGELVIEPLFTTEQLLIRSLFATKEKPPKIRKGLSPKTSVTVATKMSTAAIEAGAAANKISGHTADL